MMNICMEAWLCCMLLDMEGGYSVLPEQVLATPIQKALGSMPNVGSLAKRVCLHHKKMLMNSL